MTTQTHLVSGLTCEHCARAVTQELRTIAGVSAVDVDLVAGGLSTVTVTVTSQQPLTDESVAAALDEAGDYRLAG